MGHSTENTGNGAGPSEAELSAWLAAAQRGDKRAFGRIVEHYYRLVATVAYRLSGDAQLADDVAQDTFLRAWRSLPRFEPERQSSLRAWLCRIAHNRTVDAMRQRNPAGLNGRHHDPGCGPQELARRAEVADAVQEAILRLPEHCRTALVLREYEGLSYSEIAAALDIPIGTVMSRLHSARRRLAVELQSLVEAGAG